MIFEGYTYYLGQEFEIADSWETRQIRVYNNNIGTPATIIELYPEGTAFHSAPYIRWRIEENGQEDGVVMKNLHKFLIPIQQRNPDWEV